MSYISGEDNGILFQKDTRADNSLKRRERRNMGKENLFVTKTLYDPEDMLSKRCKKKLLSEALSSFSPNVPYSMNKSKRWQKFTTKSILTDAQENLQRIEVVVVHRTEVPLKGINECSNIRNFEIIDDGRIAKLSSTERSKHLKYFNDRLGELRHLDNETTEPPRIHINFSKDFSKDPAKPRKKKSKRANSRRVVLEKYVWDCTGDVTETDKLEKNGKLRTFLHLAWKERKSEPKHRLSQQCPDLPLTSRVLKRSFDNEDFFKRPSLLDVTAAIEAPYIFEVIEIKIKKLDNIDLRKQFLPLVPPAFVVRWFGSNRVSISSPSYAKPSFVIFFEHEENGTTFRVRINTNSQYCEEANKENLLTIVQDRIYRDHEKLFDDLYRFILRTKKMDYEIDDDGRRFAICPESFDYNVNSTVIAPNATLFMDQEQVDHLSQLYTQQNPEISSFEFIHQAGDPRVCCTCRVVKDDLFSSTDGLICRDCIISSITRQLHTNQPQIQIPIVAPPNSSSVALLAAVVPLPLLSVLVRKLYAQFEGANNPKLQFLNCPRCLAVLVPAPNSEFGCCSCTNRGCGCAFCYLCESEPHWPITCEQYKRWAAKWDTQYLLEQKFVDGAGHVRLCVQCGEAFQVYPNSAHTRCPREMCRCGYWSQDWDFHHWHDYTRPYSEKILNCMASVGYTMENCSEFELGVLNRDEPCILVTSCWIDLVPSFVKTMHNPREKRLQGYPIEQDTIELHPLLNKNISELCGHARRQRFEEQDRKEFENFVADVFPMKKVQRKLRDTRNLVLFLVENCTAWLYLTKPIDNRLKIAIVELFSQLLDIQRRIPEDKNYFLERMQHMEVKARDLIALVNDMNSICITPDHY